MAKKINIALMRKRLGITRTELAKLAAVVPSTVWRWEKKGVPEGGAAQALLQHLEAKAKAMEEQDKAS